MVFSIHDSMCICIYLDLIASYPKKRCVFYVNSFVPCDIISFSNKRQRVY